MCLTGPPLRATGMPYDVRRAHPYSVYPELEFDIPTRTEGDSYARYLLHLDEIKQSIHIIDQVLHQMPDGPVMAKLPRLLRVPPGRAFVAIESPRGQYGVLRHQRRLRPALPAAHPRPLVLQPAGGRPADARPPGRGHDGHHGQPRPDHGRGRQVTRRLSRPWSRLTLAGKIILPLLALVAVLTMALLVWRRAGLIPCLVDMGCWTRVGANIGIVRFVVAATAILLLTVPTAFMIIFFEMKVIAFVNLRIGPNRVGPVGHARLDRPRLQGAGQGGLHAHRRRRAGLHPGAGRRLPRQRS